MVDLVTCQCALGLGLKGIKLLQAHMEIVLDTFIDQFQRPL